MDPAEKVIAELQEYHDREWTDERTYPATRETRKRVTGNAISLLKEQQAEIERTRRDGKTCDNCSRCKTRMANGTGCYYPRCKKHNMWVRSGFYCSDWQKEGD